MAINYNNLSYSVFPEWLQLSSGSFVSAFKYTYIQSVSVSVPASEQVYYEIVDITGNPITEPVAAVAPTDSDSGLSYVGIRPKNLSQTVDTQITFTVTDVYGFRKTVNVPLRLEKK
jgi:uncharacterized protein (DUF1015 family)